MRRFLASTLLLLSSASAHALAATPSCHSPLTGFSVTKTDEGYVLEIEIRNEDTTDVAFGLGPNTLRLQAVEAGTGNPLVVPVALPAPNVDNLVLKPGESFKQSFLLEGLILDLKSALAHTDVRVSWILDLQPEQGCVTLSARGSALLRH
jgi:hypothetical protein